MECHTVKAGINLKISLALRGFCSWVSSSSPPQPRVWRQLLNAFRTFGRLHLEMTKGYQRRPKRSQLVAAP